MRAAFCVSGRGTLFRAAVRKGDVTAALLVTETKAATELDDFAREHGIRHVRLDPKPRETFDREITRVLVEAQVDLVVTTFDRILPGELVRHYVRRIINVHPALLPAFAGMRGIERTIESGVRFGGATIHEIVEAVDAGPIIAQCVVGTIPEEPAEEYGRRMYALLEPMFLDVLRWYAEGRVTHDESGRVVVLGAAYGRLPVSPT